MGKAKKATPEKREIKLTEAALKDIEEIISYISFVQQQPLNAVRIGDAFFKAIDKIEQNPFAYKECPAIPTKSKMYRMAVCRGAVETEASKGGDG